MYLRSVVNTSGTMCNEIVIVKDIVSTKKDKSFWEYSFIMNKHNQKPVDIINKQDVAVYLTYIKILKYWKILSFQLHIPEAILKVLSLKMKQ